MTHKQLPKYILLPISKLYEMGVELRNRLFDWGILKQESFDIPIVVVGNIAVGGTGKTPHTEYIINELKQRYNIGIISRGYKRKTKGFVIATKYSTPNDIGDEPYQIYNKFERQIPVAVCENRRFGIAELLRLEKRINLIILDDAFQHRYVKPSTAILLTEFNRPLFYDSMLPLGNLREPIHALNRADIVIVTKCPDQIKPMEYRIFNNKLKTFPYQQIFFSKYSYGQLIPLFPKETSYIPYLDWLNNDDIIFAISGIGNPRPFIKFLKSHQAKVKINIFPDHHNFNKNDLDFIQKRFLSFDAERKYIITTEKDAVRLINNTSFPNELKQYIYYLPISVEFSQADNSNNFIEYLISHIEKNKTNLIN